MTDASSILIHGADQNASNSPNTMSPPVLPRATPQTPRHHYILPTHGEAARERLPVRVACHRGDWRQYCENTIEAIESSLQMGADIVEIDIWRTRDGALILMHDPTLDRTSSGSGKIADHTLAEIRELRLKDGLSNMTEFTIPTLEEALVVLRRYPHAMLNLDKADLYLAEVAELLERTGTAAQVIVKSETPYPELCAKWGTKLVQSMIFMPVIFLKKTTTTAEIDAAFAPRHDLYEINFESEPECAGVLAHLRRRAAETGATLWMNSIWPCLCGGHSDDRALKNPDATWGVLVRELGAGVVQTDRPQLLLAYLKSQGLR